LFKDRFLHGRGFHGGWRRDGLWTRDNRRLVHPGTAVRFSGQPDRDKITSLSAADTGSDHDRIAGRKKFHGQHKD
jgi:hypothetical protein